MLKIFSKIPSNLDFVKINLTEEKASSAYSEDAKFAVNANGGFDIYVNTQDYKWYQQAARTIASLNIHNLELSSCKKLAELELYWFATALVDGIHDFNLVYDLDDKALLKIEDTVNLVSAFRAIADSDSKISTPLKLINNLFNTIKTCSNAQENELSLKIIKRGDTEFESLSGLKAVGAASNEAPCLGIIDYAPNGVFESEIEIGLVGKGITFDTGGYSLKPERFMETMRTDKTAVVYLCGALALAIKLGLNKHVRLYLCCSENMVSGTGMLPGDIINYKNDVSVEINNTDAEGRLVLADGLLKAQDDKAKFILDMATLTGAAKIAVGRDMFSVLTKEPSLNEDLQEALNSSEEMYWQLPLKPYHRRFLSSRRATVTNSGHGDGAPGSSVAASFLELFVNKDTPWVHIDLSSAYLPDGSPFLAAGPSGSGILGIANFLVNKK